MIVKATDFRVAFRVDGGAVLGLGHLNRCLSIANHLSHQGVQPIFIISNSSIRERILSYGYKIFKINKSQESLIMKKILKKENCKILVVDSKRQSVENVLRYLQRNVKTVLIDNPKLAKYADLVILPGMKEQFRYFPKNSLVGKNYVILGPNFPLTKKFKKNEYILTSTGGSDKKNITYQIVFSFSKLKSNFKMLVILGRFYKYEKKIRKLIGNDKRFRIVKDPKNLPELMARCFAGMITFGVMVYEAAAANLPVFVISHSKENDLSARKIQHYGWFIYLGRFDLINYSKAVMKVTSDLKNPDLLRKMSKKGKIIDGKGAQRIATAIIKLANEH